MASGTVKNIAGSSLIVASIAKAADQHPGLALYKSKYDDSLILTKMAASSKFWMTGLSVGMTILSINNADATRLTENSAQILMQTSSIVTILAKFPDEMFAPGALVTAVTKKELKETKVGLALIEVDGKVIVDEIVPNSLAEETNLKKGMEMLRIENFECTNKAQSADLLRLKSGTLAMLARVPGPPQATAYYVTATVPSVPSRRDKVILIGLDLVEDTKNSGIFIADIDKNGPYADSKLRVGMELLTINNIRPHTLADARALLERACDYLCLTILAKEGGRTPPGTLVTATVTKEHVNHTLGILLGMDHQQKVVIKRIQDSSLISNTMLEPGMILHSVGNIPMRGRHNTEASRIMAAAERHVTLLAEAPTSSGQCPNRARTIASLFLATFYKRLQDMNVGIKLARQNGRVVVANLEEGGLGAATGLRVGMTVLKINNEDCTTKSVDEATSLFTEANGIVTILAYEEPPIRQLLTASFVKTKDSKVGIRLRAFKGSVAITHIVKDTLAAATDLLGGMLFKSINNVDCAQDQPEKVAKLLMEADGAITILAATPDCKISTSTFVTATIEPHKDGVDKDIFTCEGGKLMISEWGAKGLFFGTALRPGMEVLTLNNVDSDVFSMAGVLSLLEEETVTILAKRPELPSGLIVAEAIHKEPEADSTEDSIGVQFAASNGRLLISSIADGSSASKSKLMVGMQVFMIGNATCVGLSAERAMELVSESTEDVVIVAGTPSEISAKRQLMVTTLTKESAETPLGLEFSQQDGKVSISKIIDGSLAADSDLCLGMELLSVNNVDCTRKRLKEVNSLLSEAEGRLTILTERSERPSGKYVTAAIYKSSVDTMLGVTMLQQGERVYFKYINPDGPAGDTDLEVGMLILTINNIRCLGMSVKQVVTHLRSAKNMLTILAQTTDMKFEEEQPDDGSLNDSDVTMDFDPDEDEDEKDKAKEDADASFSVDGDKPSGEESKEGADDRGFDTIDADAWD